MISYHHVHPSSPFPRSAIPSSSKLDLPSSAHQDSSFSFEGTSPARTTLLLGLRLLPQSRDLWREYIKLELGWVEALRRRWRVLGINGTAVTLEDSAFQGNDQELIGGEGSFGPEGEEARQAILAGQLVVHAISSALEVISAKGGTGFREELLDMLRVYPSPLRSKALVVVYDDLEEIARRGGKAGAQARLLVLTKRLYDRPYDPTIQDNGGMVLSGLQLVEEIGRIGKDIRRSAKTAKGSDWADVAGSWMATHIDQLKGNDDLVHCLSTTATSTDYDQARIPPVHPHEPHQTRHASITLFATATPPSSRWLAQLLRTTHHRSVTRYLPPIQP